MEFGPEIKIDGERPEWLTDGVACMVSWGGTAFFGPYDSDAIHGWKDTVSAIKLPADHPHYNSHSALSGADGSSYYDLQINGVTVSCNDVIDALGLNFNRGNILKAIWRMGKKPGTDEKYDLDKIVYYAIREAGRNA